MQATTENKTTMKQEDVKTRYKADVNKPEGQ